MKNQTGGLTAKAIKRLAKKLRREQGVTHGQALELLSKENGFVNWMQFQKQLSPSDPVKPSIVRPAVPHPAALAYHHTWTGKVIGKHPNRKMTVSDHSKVGSILKELLYETEYHKRAHSAIMSIIIILDTWLGCEYDDNQLPLAAFNQIYYGDRKHLLKVQPSPSRQRALKRMLRKAIAIIDSSYHDCKPLDKLHERFALALRTMDKWPATVKPRIWDKGEIPAGTFITIKESGVTGLVFQHSTYHKMVEGYSDAGYFVAGRDEVSVLRKQPKLADFKPMRLYLPYFKGIQRDGHELLFNRDYTPLWKRSPDGLVSPVRPDVDIDLERTEAYFLDRNAPYYDNKTTLDICNGVLKEWGTLGRYPEVMSLIPTAIAARDIRLLSPNGMS